MKKIEIKVTKYYKKEERFVTLACQFKSEIIAELYGREYNAKSIMNTLLIENADKILFTITGADEKEAEKAIKGYFKGEKERNV